MIRKLYAKNFATKNFARSLEPFSLAVIATMASNVVMMFSYS